MLAETSSEADKYDGSSALRAMTSSIKGNALSASMSTGVGYSLELVKKRAALK